MKDSIIIALRNNNAPFLDILQYTQDTKENEEVLLRNLLQAVTSFKNRYKREPKTENEWLAVISYFTGNDIEFIFYQKYTSYMINNGSIYSYELGEDFELLEVEKKKKEKLLVINDTLPEGLITFGGLPNRNFQIS